MIGVGVIGYGYWGPNLVRNLFETKGVIVRHVADLKDENLAAVRARYPSVTASSDVEGMLADPAVQAVVVATPTSSHFALAMRALKAGKHVLVEKPLTTRASEARLLIEEATKRKLVLMVDHTFIYTPAVRKMKALIQSGDIGDILYYDSTRINLGLFQHDVDVIWDLAVHDISILSWLVDQRPQRVSASGLSHFPGNPANVAYLTLFYADNLIGHVNVNWLAPVKIRRTLIGGSRKMIVYDDLEPSEKLRIYDKGVTMTDDPEQVRRMQVGYRIGDMWAPNLASTEALRAEMEHFADCIRTGGRPDSDGRIGLAVVELLEAATQSMNEQGRPIDLPPA